LNTALKATQRFIDRWLSNEEAAPIDSHNALPNNRKSLSFIQAMFKHNYSPSTINDAIEAVEDLRFEVTRHREEAESAFQHLWRLYDMQSYRTLQRRPSVESLASISSCTSVRTLASSTSIRIAEHSARHTENDGEPVDESNDPAQWLQEQALRAELHPPLVGAHIPPVEDYSDSEDEDTIRMPTPPMAVVHPLKDDECHSRAPTLPPPQVLPRSGGVGLVRQRPDSPRNHKEQGRSREDLLIELSRREEERVRILQYNDTLHERISSMERKVTALDTALFDTEHALRSTRQELSASQAFVASEGGVDAQFLIKMMRDLNTSIGNFAFELIEVIPETALIRKVSRDRLENLSLRPGYKITTFLDLAYNNRVTVGDFIEPFVQYAICMRLLEVVFSPWVPGMPREESKIFHGIYDLVHQRESQVGIKVMPWCVLLTHGQERSARWRAITYSHAWREREDGRLCETVGRDVLLQFADCLGLLCAPDEVSFNMLESVFGEGIWRIFMDAIKFQDKARASYMSFDYNATTSRVDEPFNPLFMETNEEARQGSKHKSSKVILPIGLGLQAWKSVVREDKTIGKEVQVALKCQVLCETWSPSAS
jgi:hypothetical protein